MKLYKITQSHNNDWYTYDSAIVAAESAKEAKKIQPSPRYKYDDGFYYLYNLQEASKEKSCPNWAHPKHVKAKEIGTTDLPAGEVVETSMRAGFDESHYLTLRKHRQALRRSDIPKIHKRGIADAMVTIEEQTKDIGLAELRYHYIEANRATDMDKMQEYEIKMRDYMGEIYEDWS